MDIKAVFNILGEVIYTICGLVAIGTAIRGLKNEKKRIGTFLFWGIVGAIFILGKHIPYKVTGGLIVILAVITLSRQTSIGKFKEIPFEFRKAKAKLFGNKIFIPALLIGVLSFLFLQFKIAGSKVPTAVGLGLASIVAFIVAFLMFKPNVKENYEDTNKMLMQVGPSVLLPQLLTGLGAVFTSAGIGTLISQMFSSVIPENNLFIAVVIYCLSMAIFTMIMGNGFAAFSVITTGLAVPFLLAKGASIPVIGALGMTAGFCGTLMTPMAANFNIVSAAVLETKSSNTVIKSQVFVAIPLLIIHIALMYFLAF
ncbi:MAG: hypothetical protein CR988_01815 [Treponema sp.]|nr:MAG: hypothetical protein CR988_01815 [Treponema sp.]